MVRAFDTPFCAGRVRANHVDVEVVHCATELRKAVAGFRVLRVDAKDGRLVAVERDGLSVAAQIAARRLKVFERRLRACEAQLHDAAGGVVDVHERGAFRTAVLELIVEATIDLNETSLPGAKRTSLTGRHTVTSQKMDYVNSLTGSV